MVGKLSIPLVNILDHVEPDDHVWSGVRGEECPGGSKNGHRRDRLPARICSQPPNESLPSSRATAPEEVHDQRNDGDYQQKVNQPTGNVEREKSQQPQYKQHNE